MKRTVTAFSIVLLVSACTPVSKPASVSDAIGETSWVLISGSVDGTDLTMVEGFPVTLERTPTGIKGTAACNRYSAVLSDDGGPLFASLYADLVACSDPAAGELQTLALQGLASVTDFELDGDDLILKAIDIELSFSPRG